MRGASGVYQNARTPVVRLSAVMSGLFVLLSIPVLIFILVYNYRQNVAAINVTLNDVVTKTKQVSIGEAGNLINPVAATLTLVAAVAAEVPEEFRKEASRDLLYRALTSAPQIDAAYVSFEDGYHRVVTRIDDDRRHSDPKIPPSANWHSSYIDSFSGSPRRLRHRTFFDTWPHVVGSYDVEQTMDIEDSAGVPGREGRARPHRRRTVGQSGHRLSDHFRPISDHQGRRVHRLCVCQYHTRHSVAVSQ